MPPEENQPVDVNSETLNRPVLDVLNNDSVTSDEPSGDDGGGGEILQDILDLDQHETVRFQGKEYTQQELMDKLLGKEPEADEFSQHRDFYLNLDADLMKIAQSRGEQRRVLSQQFREIYPKKFHSYLGVIKDGAAADSRLRNSDSNFDAKQVIDELREEIKTLKSEVTGRFEHQDSQSRRQQLDLLLPKLGEKYPYADIDGVLAKAEALLMSNKRMEMTPGTWERLFKQAHSAMEARVEKHHNGKLKEQLEIGAKNRDTGAGGVPVGHRQKARTIKEATEGYLKSLGR